MKEKTFNLFIVVISIFLLGELLFNKTIIYESILYSLNLWVNNLIPSFFSFFIISNILINYNITDYIPKIIKEKCTLIFNISDNMLTIFLLSMISGFPSNARITRTMYENKKITLNEANHILLFSHFANPVFILSTVATFFLHNEKAGIIVLISHYVSNFILGIIFRNSFYLDNSNEHKFVDKSNNFANIFIDSIRNAVDTIITICGILTFFLMFSSIIVNLFHLNVYNTMIIKSIFEITIGIEALSKLNLSLLFKTVLTTIILSFGGLCVHVQVISQIVGTNIKYIYYFIGRLYQAIISGIIAYILCLVFQI